MGISMYAMYVRIT